MQTAVIYARYSSDSQTEQSIEGQLRVCEDYAKRNNILILNTYIDRAMSGTNDHRPDFQRMLKDSAKREWNYVLVYRLDRFSRNKYETAMHKKTLRDNGVKVLSAMENIPDTPEGIILESLLEGMSEYFSRELAQKVARGMRECRLKGLYQGGGIPYGYKVENRHLVIDEAKAQNVLYIYEQYSKGVYVKDIIAALTKQGMLYKGRPFAKNTIYGILANEKYSGIYRHGDEVYDNMYPRIIPKDLFEAVRKIVETNKYGKRSIKEVYLLRSKLFCGYCDRPMSAETGTARNGQVKHYYKCIGRKADHSHCMKTTIPKEYLEELVIDTIIDELSKPDLLDNVVGNLMKIQKEQQTDSTSIKILTQEKRKIDKALENMVAAIEQGVISNTTNKRIHELEAQQEDLERKILIERSRASVIIPENDIREYYEQALRLEPQMLITYLVKKIVLYDDKMQIYFNSPFVLSPDRNNGQGVFFYRNVRKLSFRTTNNPQIKKRPILTEFYIL